MAGRLGQAELGHQRLEVVAVGTKAVHEDHSRIGAHAGPFGFDLHRLQLGHRVPTSSKSHQ